MLAYKKYSSSRNKAVISFHTFTLLCICLLTGLASGTAHALSISDSVWIDSNKNGIRDNGEPPLANAQVKLYFDNNRDGVPERMVDVQTTDGNGDYEFSGHPSGKYQVIINMADMPDNLYRVTQLNVGENEATDNDVDSNTLRTDILELTDGNGVYSNLADIGVELGNAELFYEGLHPWNNGAVTVQRWSYQNIGLVIDDNGKPITDETYTNVRRWMQWYAKADKISQELHQKKNWWQQTRYPEGYGPLDTGKKIFVTSSQNGSLGGGPFASSGTPPQVVWDNPTNLAAHRLMLYEMQRGLGGFWRGRGLWPSNAGFSPNFGVGDIVIVTPHLLNAWNTFALGGESAMYDRLEGQWVAGDLITGLREWERVGVSLRDAMPGFEATTTIPLMDPLDGSVKRRYAPYASILLEIGMIEGMDKLAEMLTNLGQAKVPGSADQAFMDFYTAINQATDGKYASKLINDWGLPAGPYTSTRGISSGEFIDLSRYQWDFGPHGIPDSALLPGYRHFTERTTQGFMRFAGDVSPGSYFYDIVAANTPGDHSFVQVPRDSVIEHQVRNGLWTVTMEMTAYYRNPILAEGQTVTPLETPVDPGDKANYTFQVQVTDGVLNIEFRGDPHIFNMALESDNAAPPSPPPEPPPPAPTPTLPQAGLQIEAEDYTNYADADPENRGGLLRNDGVDIGVFNNNYFVGWTIDGEWLEYTVDAGAQTYTSLQFVVSAGEQNAGSIGVMANGQTIAEVNVNSTGTWDNFQTVTVNDLTITGQTTIRLQIIGGVFAIDKFRLIPGSTPTPTPTPTPPPTSAKQYSLVNEGSGKCIDLPGPQGTDLIQWDCHGGDNQRLEELSANGGVMLKFRNSDQCVDVSGTRLLAWRCHGGDNQIFNQVGTQWQLKNTDQCFTIKNGSMDNKAEIEVSNCTNSPAQRFTEL